MATTPKKRRPRGDGSLQRLARDKFKIQVTVGYDASGRQRRKSFTAKTQREAVAMLDRLKAGHQTMGPVLSGGTTVEQFTARWLSIKKFTAKEKTCAAYELACVKHILPLLGRCKLTKLTTAHVNDYLRAKAQEGLSAATLSQHRAILHNILALAVTEGCLGRNAATGAGPIPRQPKEQNILTEDEMLRLLAAARAFAAEVKRGFRQIYHVILLALSTGLRRGEIVGLRWENIDLANGVLKVSENIVEIAGKQVRGTPKTQGSWRTIAVEPAVLEILRNDLWTPDGGLVFTGDNRRLVPFSTLGRTFRSLLVRAGITKKVRLHDLRHTHVTHLLAHGYDLKMVAARIGDDVRTVMQIYAHALPEKDKDAAAFIAAKLLP
ncbi:MAG: tyrosine-type recombinase/integrase [Negativicutes bacterium]|nr:tyrosine-type recombinase/integrase [Negativicutes bacterium]